MLVIFVMAQQQDTAAAHVRTGRAARLPRASVPQCAAARCLAPQQLSRPRAAGILEPAARLRGEPSVDFAAARAALCRRPRYRAYQCSKGLVAAVQHANVMMGEWLHAYCPNVLPYNAMSEAARTGNVALLQWLSGRHERVPWIPQFMDAAASAGQIQVLEWLHDHPKNSGCSREAFI